MSDQRPKPPYPHAREMTEQELKASHALRGMLQAMDYADAMVFLVNELCTAMIHMGTPRHILDKMLDATWPALADAHLPKKEGVA